MQLGIEVQVCTHHLFLTDVHHGIGRNTCCRIEAGKACDLIITVLVE